MTKLVSTTEAFCDKPLSTYSFPSLQSVADNRNFMEEIPTLPEETNNNTEAEVNVKDYIQLRAQYGHV